MLGIIKAREIIGSRIPPFLGAEYTSCGFSRCDSDTPFRHKVGWRPEEVSTRKKMIQLI